MIAALLWKEWREQRWRCVLGTLVLATLAASLVRAQLVTLPESVLILFGPVGLLLAIFLAMGSVATEREDNTWDFLTARPVRRALILRLKWLIGAVHLVVAFLIAGVAAHAAGWSRALFDVEPVPDYLADQFVRLIPWGNSASWLWMMVLLSLVAMLAWYTVLFFVLTRARNELHAGLGGILLTLACLAWLLQYPISRVSVGDWMSDTLRSAFWTSSLLNPLSPVVFVFEDELKRALAVTVALVLWVLVPVLLVGRLDRRRKPS